MKKKGFTFIEVLFVIGVIAVLAAIMIIAINPARQFTQARNNQRRNDVSTILDAVHRRITDNKGSFAEGTTCDALPGTTSTITSTVAAGNVNLCDCLVNNYLAEMPFDPRDSSAGYKSCADYDTGYTIIQDAATGRITVSAPSAELDETINVTR